MYKWNLCETCLCPYCNTHPETIVHLFCMCPVTLTFFLSVNGWNHVILNCQETLWNQFCMVFSKSSTIGIVSNDINVYIKQIVFQFKKNNKCLSLYKFIRKLIDTEQMEHVISIKNNKVYKNLYKREL